MTVYDDNNGFRVIEEGYWFYPMRWDGEMELFVNFLDKDGFEVRFSTEAAAIDYLAGK